MVGLICTLLIQEPRHGPARLIRADSGPFQVVEVAWFSSMSGRARLMSRV